MGVTAQQLLNALFNAGIAISVGATVLSLGMTFTVGQLVAPLHRVVLVIGLVVLNAVVIPAAAWGIAEVSPMGSKYVPGLRPQEPRPPPELHPGRLHGLWHLTHLLLPRSGPIGVPGTP